MNKILIFVLAIFSFSTTSFSERPKELEFKYLPCKVPGKDKSCNEEDIPRAKRGLEKKLVTETIKLERIAKKKDPLGQIRSNNARSRSTWIGGTNPAAFR